MELIKEIKAKTDKCAGSWEVYLHDSVVYVKMVAGFGVSKKLKGCGIMGIKFQAISLAKEITKLSEKKANELWKSLGWNFWQYDCDHNLKVSQANKAPIV